MTYYLVSVPEIPANGINLEISSVKDAWFREMMKAAISGQVSSFKARLSVKVTKFEKSIEVIGGVYLVAEIACDRCLADYEYEQQIPFRILLEPLPKSEPGEQNDEAENINESLDFSYYKGDEIDIGDLIRQHVLMSQPVSHICSDDCKGLCQRCGKNLNEGPCDCKDEEKDEGKKSPFSVLKGFGTGK